VQFPCTTFEQIAEKLGIRIKRAPSDDFSGILLRKDGKALIGVNNTESHVRQRFTIAHELGHFFLHQAKDAFVDYRDNQHGGIRSSKEREANMFAAAFLIPRTSLVADVKKISSKGIFEIEIENLAKKYDVSKESMNYRLLNLGLAAHK
jgi:Zn-dependent peptidase ImmA (M78 family)